MNKEMILGVIRHLLTAFGGAFAANGAVTSTDIETIIGGVVALVGVVWSVISKK